LDPGVYVEETSLRAKAIDGVETSNEPEEPPYPGVYVEETSLRAKPIDGVETTSGSDGGRRLGLVSAAAAFAANALRGRRRLRRPSG